ncbi:GAF domain-containing protein [Rhodoferax saidenbachensis]|uniref:GAF domain-containing protein n=1 Tax=Rhodoferax saidenbachensis TaxID=1484693 RepID=A0A1P8KEE9_9BURK|nr:GAF domain-containing protein [Rhodoferax saidenbachensis]APW44346.1 GAF domain-containing protein [Rhodoferax saidenbachensis]
MSGLTLGAVRASLQGAIPTVMATCSSDGVPNVAYISQAFYVDERHLALSFQFLNKTRQNILANPHASLLVLHPVTAQFHRINIRYLRTETQGPLYESMKAQLAGIASHTGMASVFHLRGSDIYEVQNIDAMDCDTLPEPAPQFNMLSAVRRSSERLARCSSLDELLNATLISLTDFVGVRHAMVLMLDPVTQRLYTVASCGYACSGIGSEIDMGDGVIGVAARERTPVSIMHMTNAYQYSSAIRSSLQASSPGLALEADIPWPGLSAPHSQLAVPIQSAGRLLGVLFVESQNDMEFGFETEDVLVAVAGHLGAGIDLMQDDPDAIDVSPLSGAPSVSGGQPLQIRHFNANGSVFIDGDYLIKGVAGAIFWKLVRDFTAHGRTEFTNRELRLDPDLGLPDVTDNLEARLVLLQRRLNEHATPIRIEKTGRGRFRLNVQRPLELLEAT